MAGYTILSGEPTLKIFSEAVVYDAQLIIAEANASGVVYNVLFFPYPAAPDGTVIWTPPFMDTELSLWAGRWDQNRQVPGVLAINITQQVQPDGTLADVAIVTVSSTSGRLTSQVTVGVREWLPSVAGTTLTTAFPTVIAAERANLDEIEAASTPPVDAGSAP